ncbi:hypothetical protein V499_02142 [Pseudogymnoascus sp. VKM F-103]|nr:hypothetical protein V499_02142 [Pseudogymnoascus sp. VKM F-103]
MSSFALLYFLYGVKLCSQASIYFIWLVDSSSEAITFIAATVAVLAVFPFFHVIVHVFLAKPLSSQGFVAYLCISLMLAILWYKPTQDGQHRSLSFAVVTSFDLFDALLFLFQRQITCWRGALLPDTEEGHVGLGNNNGALMTPSGEGEEQAIPGAEKSPSELRRLRILKELGYNYSALSLARSSATSIETDPQSVMEIIRSSGISQMSGGRVGTQRPNSPAWSFRMAQLGNESMSRAEEGEVRFVINETMYAGSEMEEPRSQTPTTVINTNLHQNTCTDMYLNSDILSGIHPALSYDLENGTG